MGALDTVTVTAGEQSYTIGQAPALKQKTLVTIVGVRSAVAASGADEMSVPVLKGMLLMLSEQDLDRVNSIILPRVFKTGTTDSVSVEDFQGQMDAYLTVLAEGIKVNLDDFFTFLIVDQKAARDKAVKATPAQ